MGGQAFSHNGKEVVVTELLLGIDLGTASTKASKGAQHRGSRAEDAGLQRHQPQAWARGTRWFASNSLM
jgi:hypothetical protein